MQDVRRLARPVSAGIQLPAIFIAAAAVSAAAICAAPLTASIVTVFLFAGLHNFMEFRYFAARMPVSWGRSRGYYLTGIGGVIVLTAAYLAIYFGGGRWLWDIDEWLTAVAAWDTAFILWVGWLFFLRRGKERGWMFGVIFLLAALAWLVPSYWSLALVYVHPFVAMWFLERQIRRTRPEWLRGYHLCLASLPVFLAMIWLMLAGTPDLPGDNSLFARIAQHAGSGILPGVSSRMLVATHVFLESVHYAVWIVLIPLADPRAVPWRLRAIPLFSRSNGFPKMIAAVLFVGVLIAAALWTGFALDYERTRDIYFAFAVSHVLAEFPFLVKML